MAIQSSTPCTIGFKPTAFNTLRESEAPIKNSVNVSDLRANELTKCPTARPVSDADNT